MNARALLVLAIALLLAGCGSFGRSVPAVVKVAVPVPCQVSIPAMPVFPADTLTGAEDLFTLAKTLWADHQARKAYELELRVALEACTAPIGGAG